MRSKEMQIFRDPANILQLQIKKCVCHRKKKRERKREIEREREREIFLNKPIF